MTTIAVDDLQFELRGSDRRRSLQITVDREGELVLFAPPDCETAVLEGFVREKRSWIYRKLAEKEMLREPVSAREYVSGEGFPYLGRNYRLLLVSEQSSPVKLEGGRFKMLRSAASEGRRHMVRWYEEHAERWLADRVERLATALACVPPASPSVISATAGGRVEGETSCTSTGALSFFRPASWSTSWSTNWFTSTKLTTRPASGSG